MSFLFRPKFIDVLAEGYSRSKLTNDVVAGLIVGLLAVPLAIGFGIASIPVTPPPGVPSPAAMGLYTAVVAGFLISALGGSRVQIGGPTGAFVPVIALIVSQHGLAGLWLATFMAGLLLLLLGIFRAGSFSRFIPLPVVIGFTSGIAVIIGVQQIKDLLGLHLDKPLPAETPEKLHALWEALPLTNLPTLAVSAACLLLVFAAPEKWRPRVLVLFVGAVVANVLGLVATPANPHGVATIGSTFGHPEGDQFVGAIPTGLPHLIPLQFSWGFVREMIPSAAVIAFLGALESILSAMATDKMIGDRHNADQELVAQGVANCVVPWIGGIPVTGAIARSSTNVQSGGRSPVAGIVHAVFLAAVLFFAGPLVSKIPLCVLAAILVHVAVRMFEFRHFVELRQVTRSELAIATATFLITVLTDLNYGVGFGLAVAAGTLILRLREITAMREVNPENDPDWLRDRSASEKLPEGVQVFQVAGVLFYAVADDLRFRVEKMLDAHPGTRLVILRTGKMLSIDFQGLTELEALMASLKERGVHLLLCDAQPHPSTMMMKHGFFDQLGLENLCGDLATAIRRAHQLLEERPTSKPA
ncbi:MAG TPA: SulP family inorganic anion transporter [Chthoniobacterales bacterium]